MIDIFNEREILEISTIPQGDTVEGAIPPVVVALVVVFVFTPGSCNGPE
jgi:hypothetical protein